MARRHSVLALAVLLTSVVSAVPLGRAVQSSPPIVTADCGTGTGSLIANVSQVVAGSSGTILFSCGANDSAIAVINSGTVAPELSLPSGYASLMISTSPICASGISLVSGSPLTFGTGTGMLPLASYNYCASFSNAPQSGLGTFTVTWTQSTAVSTIGCGHNVSCNVESNATLSNVRFAGVTIHIEANGSSGAHGYANVTVPKSSIPHISELHVFVDNSKLTSSAVTITSNSTAYFIYFTFTFHSPVLIDIQLTAPENAATPTILGLDPTLFYEIVGALVALVVMVSAALVLRRRGRTRSIT